MKSGYLYTSGGERKFLNATEQDKFLEVARSLDRVELSTFALTLAYTGCRITEALELTPERVNILDKSVTFRNLKQGRNADGNPKLIYRSVPVPDELVSAFEQSHQLGEVQKLNDGESQRLWQFKRAMASRHVAMIMSKAGISGKHATASGLRHGFGIRMVEKSRNPRLVQQLLGHKSLDTTAMYMDSIDEDVRNEVMSAWRES